MKTITLKDKEGNTIVYSSNLESDPNFETLLSDNPEDVEITVSDEATVTQSLDTLFENFNNIFGNPDVFSFFSGKPQNEPTPIKEDNVDQIKQYFSNCGAFQLDSTTMIYNVPFSKTYFHLNLYSRLLTEGVNGEGILEKDGVYIETVEQLSNLINE